MLNNSKFQKFDVILPCAGFGTRLGLDYPKELFKIYDNKSLIDFSMSTIYNARSIVKSVILVLREGKEDIYQYVIEKYPLLEVRYVYQKAEFFEWPGAILSAVLKNENRSYFTMLPDSVIFPLDNSNVILSAHERIQKGADIVFGFKKETDRSLLGSLGALQVENGRVLDFRDKPSPQDASRFNSFWCCFAFGGSFGSPLLELMSKSVLREKVEINLISQNISGFEIDEYLDLGTWDNIKKFKSRNISSLAG